MESSSSHSCCRYTHLNHHRFVQRHLGPAIKGKSCPICLTQIREAAVITVCFHAYCIHCIHKWSHLKRKCPLCNAQFASLFVGIDLNSLSYSTQHLSPLKESGTKFTRDSNLRQRDLMAQRRAIGIAREEVNVVSRRTRPLMKQRSFGQYNMQLPGVNKTRILQWRASVYEQNMRALPCPTRKSLQEGLMGRNSNSKSRVLQRIEPWIHRELHAVLGDPNPAILVHLVTSTFISSLEEMQQKAPSGTSGVENSCLDRLQPFLLGRTSTFWHELRCFAESQLNMEAYDTVVKYVKW